jgi:ABC-2 type transport system ATP-binding protein
MTRASAPGQTRAEAPASTRRGEVAPDSSSDRLSRASVIEARGVWRYFGDRPVLRDLSLDLGPGEIHALLGPNGAGKTTLVRILAGLLTPSSGAVKITGIDASGGSRSLRQRLGLIPSGDRTFYLRLTGTENLVFFARLHGMRRKVARGRARKVLEEVGLEEAADVPVGIYSHGMQKRLSVARALLTAPAVLIVDEATHDLDPVGARTTRDLVRELAERGTAAVWATQRLDEIRGFADGVTLLDHGETCFQGTVPELMTHAVPRRYLLRLRNGRPTREDLGPALAPILGDQAVISAASDDDAAEYYTLTLAEGVVLGDALASLTGAGVDVLACREERSEIEEAFLSLTGRPQS